MLNRCDSFNGAIIILCRCDKLLILGYTSVQEVDSKMGAYDLCIVKGSFHEIYAK